MVPLHPLDDGWHERRNIRSLSFEAWHPHKTQLGLVFAEDGILEKCEGGSRPRAKMRRLTRAAS
jgi:hypothetical protein